jgi:hypothetical protein
LCRRLRKYRVERANEERSDRYARGYELLVQEIDLVAKPGARIIAIGRAVESNQRALGFKRPSGSAPPSCWPKVAEGVVYVKRSGTPIGPPPDAYASLALSPPRSGRPVVDLKRASRPVKSQTGMVSTIPVLEVTASLTSLGGTPGRDRTCDLRIRSPSLCPTELRAPRSIPARHVPPPRGSAGERGVSEGT